MNLALIGVNHKTAPIDRRETLSVPRESMAAFVEHMILKSGATQVVPLFTCNRVEVYGAGTGENLADSLAGAFCAYHSIETDKADWFYRTEGLAAAEHLFAVSASLDSMVVGEPQILSQVKNAYFVARELGAAGKYLNFIFQKCFKAAKEIRTRTAIARSRVSVASVAADLACRTLGELGGKTVLIVGSGKIGSAFAVHLADTGIGRIYVASRSYAHAEELAGRVGGAVVPLHRLDEYLDEVDLVVGCTSAKKPFLHRERCRAAIERRGGKALLVIDLGVPRNVAPEAGGLEGIHLYNIDQLEEVVVRNRSYREEQARRGREIAAGLARKTFEKAARLDEMPAGLRPAEQASRRTVEQ
jgi:glutamyl-tRNA reductase